MRLSQPDSPTAAKKHRGGIEASTAAPELNADVDTLLARASRGFVTLPASGPVPCARWGHQASLDPSGTQLVVYGGGDDDGSALGDTVLFDLSACLPPRAPRRVPSCSFPLPCPLLCFLSHLQMERPAELQQPNAGVARRSIHP